MKSGLFSYTISMSALSEKSRKSVEWCYALGVLGITAASGSVVCFLMFFGTAVLGLPGTLVGAAFSLSVVWDGFSDPLAGYLSDITKSRSFGRRTGYLVFGALLTALFTLLLWQTPGGGTAFRFVWLLVLNKGVPQGQKILFVIRLKLRYRLVCRCYGPPIIQGFRRGSQCI